MSAESPLVQPQRPSVAAMEPVKVHPLKIPGDLFLMLVAVLPVVVCKALNQPYVRGFYCDDESIRYPFHDSTITSATLYCVGFLGNCGIMLLLESYIYFSTKEKKNGLAYTLCGRAVHPLTARLYKTIGWFLFGCCVCISLTDIGKYTIGRLRPHFISVCVPTPSVSSCTGHEYITNYECTAHDQKKAVEARLSFPSGHSSFSTFSMLYLVFYLQARMRLPTWTPLVKPVIQLACIIFAWFTCLSRVSDYKHHWSDVLAGIVLGALVACVVAIHVANIFGSKSVKGSDSGAPTGSPPDYSTQMTIVHNEADKSFNSAAV